MKTANRVLNLLLWLAGCALAGTGLLLAYRLPPGSRGGAGLTALGMNRHEWGDWHTGIALACLLLIAAHLALHAKWLWKIAAERKIGLLVLGAGTGIALLAAIALLPVSRQPAGSHRAQATHHAH